MKNQGVFAVYKPVGATPLDMVVKLKEKFPELKDLKIGYAGRLDPMASGVLLLLVGEENKARESYLFLDKEYRAEICFNVETDTYDVLGIVKKHPNNKTQVTRNKLEKIVKSFVGKISQKYPPYSSKTIDGVPLYKLARDGVLNEEKIPQKEIEIYGFELIDLQSVFVTEVHDTVLPKINMVKGDFRQDKILKSWEQFFEQNTQDQFKVATMSISCSSGTYIRSLAHQIGRKLGAGAILYNLTRTRVGTYTLTDSITM